MKKYIVVIVILCFAETVGSQNLILNPSFESVNEITVRWSGTYIDFDKRVYEWDSPTQGSPDILHISTLDKMFPKRPKIDLSNYLPRTGDFMVGIKTFGCEYNTLHCKEYIQIQLKEPLLSGEKYYFEYWVTPIYPSVKVNSFGIALNKKRSKKLTQVGVIDINPVYTNEIIIDGDSVGWHRISGTFETDNNYEYIVIGNFGQDEEIRFQMEPGGIDYGYYLLDDVLLKHLPRNNSPSLLLNKIIVLENMFFEFDKSEIQEISKSQLDELVDYLQINQNYVLNIIGHTDSNGSDEYNLELSRARANSIKDYLVQNGIEEFRITPIGKGRSHPLINNNSEENRKVNRRVEIEIIEK